MQKFLAGIFFLDLFFFFTCPIKGSVGLHPDQLFIYLFYFLIV